MVMNDEPTDDQAGVVTMTHTHNGVTTTRTRPMTDRDIELLREAQRRQSLILCKSPKANMVIYPP